MSIKQSSTQSQSRSTARKIFFRQMHSVFLIARRAKAHLNSLRAKIIHFIYIMLHLKKKKKLK